MFTVDNKINVSILYGTYFLVKLYNGKFNISAKTLKTVY